MEVVFMNEKELYYFYFDESNRNGNIRFKNGLPNFWCKSEGVQREANYYVGCYLGWNASNLESALAEYQELEKQRRPCFFIEQTQNLANLNRKKSKQTTNTG